MDYFLNQLWISRFALVEGFLRTIEISVLSITLGTLAGLAIGVALTYGRLPLRLMSRVYVDVIRGTPVLVLVLTCFYMPSVFRVSLDALTAGVLALTLFCAAHIAEILRGALIAIPPGQMEAARSIGLTFPKILAYVLMPQALRAILPTWINTGAELVKASTLVSIIGVGELLLKTQEIVGRNFLTLDFYVVAGLLYLAVNYGIERLGKTIERRVTQA
jgi:polar amino acid transport system permease protein